MSLQVVVAQLANKRQGTNQLKQSEVRGEAESMLEVKGTGRQTRFYQSASNGSKVSCIFKQRLQNVNTKSMRKVAMTSALTSKVADMVVLEDLTFKLQKLRKQLKC